MQVASGLERGGSTTSAGYPYHHDRDRAVVTAGDRLRGPAPASIHAGLDCLKPDPLGDVLERLLVIANDPREATVNI